jgi:hypothetical protein
MTTKSAIPEKIIHELEGFLKKNRKADLISTYLFYVEKAYDLHPMVYPVGKMIFKNTAHAVEVLEKAGELWRETEITVSFEQESVNSETKKIYICPYCGKVFGDNTHPNPQDAIYDWVAKCPKNTDRVGGLPAKRFFISEDLEMIKNYIVHRTKSITKRVFSSAVSGKLFHSREAVIEEFKVNYLRPLTLIEVQSQNRFSINETFLAFLQDQLQESKIAAFVESIMQHNFFKPYIALWLEE